MMMTTLLFLLTLQAIALAARTWRKFVPFVFAAGSYSYCFAGSYSSFPLPFIHACINTHTRSLNYSFRATPPEIFLS